jgi:hypothetical protein
MSDRVSRSYEDLRAALASVARAIADSLEVREFWERRAAAVHGAATTSRKPRLLGLTRAQLRSRIEKHRPRPKHSGGALVFSSAVEKIAAARRRAIASFESAPEK